MSENKTKPTNVKVSDFLENIEDKRRIESQKLINLMHEVTGQEAVMWGPSIIGFGSVHYKYDTGREGDMPHLGFSPRKAAITIYFSEGFDRYSDLLEKLGKYKASVSCLYINKLKDIDLDALHQMLEQSYQVNNVKTNKPATVEDYISIIPTAARPMFDELRSLVKTMLPQAKEVLSYGIVGYKIDDKRARVFISGWKDHIAIYPVPRDEVLQSELKSYIKGKGTLWFPLDQPLPKSLVKKVITALTE